MNAGHVLNKHRVRGLVSCQCHTRDDIAVAETVARSNVRR